MQPIPFTQEDNQGQSGRLSSEMLVNMYAESQQNAKVPYALFGSAGLTLSDTLGAGPIRGIRTRNTDIFVVSGSAVYKNGILLTGDSLAGTGTVSMAHNSTQLVIVAGGYGYVVTTTVLRITDADWIASDTVTYLNGVFVFNERGTGRAFSSAIEDASTLDALDFATAESNADNLMGVYSEGDRLLMAGTETMEFWYNDGGPQFPFSRIPGSTAKTGLVSPYGLTFNDNTFFFVGHDLSVYRMGTVPERISTAHIERRIAGFTGVNTCEATTYARKGHIFIIFDFNEGTLIYDVVTKKWHERRSYKKSAWRCAHIWQSGAVVYAGDKVDGKVYSLDEDVYTENGNVLEAIIQTPQVLRGEEWFHVSRLKLDIETGVGLTSGQGSEPFVMMQYSDDGGKTWSYELWGDMGDIGEYSTEINWNRLARTKGRSFRLVVTDPVKRAFLGLWTNG